MAGSLFYLNADFDLSLRARPPSLQRKAARTTVEIMSVSGLLRGDEGDAVLVRAGVPEEFLRYLERADIAPPRTLRHSEIDRKLRLRPFGWSAEAMAVNEGQLEPVPHPPLDLLRLVNSRTFSAGLEAEHFDEEGAGSQFSSARDLQRWILGKRERKGGWVVKADHGNAGMGNRRLRGKELSPADLRFVEGLLREDDLVTVEPWRHRTADLCAVFDLKRDGEAGPVRLHETLYTSDGAFIGALFDKNFESEWGPSLEEAAGVVAGVLAGRGYFGPVCFDAFVYREGGKARLRPLVDLNCREAMSSAASWRWRERWTDRVLLWRFFTARRLTRGAADMIAAADGHYDPATRRGILLASPWKADFGGGQVAAPRIAVAFVGKDRSEVRAMEASFRERWER